jgi:hypothetical protein
MYAGSSGNSDPLVFGGETGTSKKAIFLESFWMIYQGHDNEGHKFRSVAAGGGYTDDMTITGGGNVGIGTTSPSYRLHVVSAAGVTARFDGSGVAANSATEIDVLGPQSNGELNLGVGGSTFTDSTNNIQNKAFITAASGLSGLNLRSDAGFVQITAGGVAASNEVARFTSGGNVGIGTTSPVYKLDVNGTGRFVSEIYTGGVYSATYGPRDSGGTISIINWGGSTLVRIQTTDGNVGIGTTSPASLLQVGGSGASPSSSPTAIQLDNSYRNAVGGNTSLKFYLYRNSNETYGIGLNNAGGIEYHSGAANDNGSYQAFYFGNSEKIRFKGDGNVGIGTTSPSTKLEIRSTAADADRTLPHNVLTITAEQGNAPYGFFGGAILFKNRSYVSGIVESSRIRSVIYDDGAPNNFGGGLWFETTPTPGGALTSSLVINYQGRVGIGTTSPLSRLHIVGSAADNVGLAMFQNEQNAGGVYFPAANFINTRGNHSYGIVAAFRTNTAGDGDRPSIIFYGAQTAASWTIGQSNSSWGTADAFAIGYRASNDPDGFTGWPTNYFTILTGGSVGIGTTSPSRALHVLSGVGTVQIQSTGTTSHMYFADANSSVIDNQGFGSVGNNLWFSAGGFERMRITSGGNVGIGNSTPQYRLDVNGGSGFAASFGGQISPGVFSGIHFGYLEPGNTSYRKSALVFERTDNHGQGGNASGKIYMLLDNRSSVSATTLSAAVMTWDTDASATLGSARVGIGSTSPAYTLDVAGTIRATGDVIAYSDARVKDNINTIEAPLDLITKLRGVTYTRKDTDDKSEKVGVIAQEVLPILPQVVQKDTNGNYSVAYGNMVGVLIEAIKEQQRQIDELKYLLQNK